MRFMGSKAQQVLPLRCSGQRGPGTASGPLYIGSLWVFQPFHAYFILADLCVGMPDITLALSGPTCWKLLLSFFFLFSFGSSSMK